MADTTVFDPTQSPALGDTNAILEEGQGFAQQTIPLQLGGLLEALAQLRAKAAGSVADIMPGILGPLASLREQYGQSSQAIARRLGYAGGGQVERGRQRLLAGATRQYASLLEQGQQEGFAGQLNVLGGFQPLLSGAASPPSVSTSYKPWTGGPALGASVGNILSLVNQLQGGPVASAGEAQAAVEAFRTGPGAAGLEPQPLGEPFT